MAVSVEIGSGDVPVDSGVKINGVVEVEESEAIIK